MANFKFFLNRQGVKGETGAKGDKGDSPSISIKTATANEYVLTITNPEQAPFDTPNLIGGNYITEANGSYVRYNQATEEFYADTLDYATTNSIGGVTLCDYATLSGGGTEGLIADSVNVYNLVDSKIAGLADTYVAKSTYETYVDNTAITLNSLSTEKLDFSDLSNSLVAGHNIALTVDSTNNTITINATGELSQVQADWDESDSSDPSYIKNKPTLGTMAGESASDYSKTSDFATVAFSGDYSDLLNTPSIPAAQVQADWSQSDSTAVDYIKNKPTIPESITVDDDFSATSTNPVENRLITNAINLISNELEDFAEKDLSNLSAGGAARLHALKAYSDKGELLTDAEGLADVTDYAHSTFDRSKFTVVGSPVITDDGIATDFSGSNRIKTTFDYASGTLEIIIGLYWESDSDGGNLFQVRQSDDTTNVLRIFQGATGNYVLYSVTGEQLTFLTTEYTPDTNDFIILKGKLNSNNTVTGIVINVTKNITISKTTTGTITNAPSSTGNILYIGNAKGNEYYAGKIDLKYTSIKNNDIEIFSGNKTGIDTIKPDDYTVVGTPTISADGIASGFSNSNYVSIPANISSNYRFEGHFTNNALSSSRDVFKLTDSALQLYFNGSGTMQALVNIDGTGTNLGTLSYSTTGSNEFDFYFENNNNTWTFGIKQGNGAWATKTTTLSSGAYLTNIMCKTSDVEWDLNTFKEYTNGSLVYQPCLKIPYTESKTGSKVVNSIYRGRVNDMAEQFGYANYYALSDTDFALPQVELYGMIERINGAIGNVDSILNSINSGNGGQ